ncbi:hypothetical protein Tco_0622996 [Tanacetum coccineum]
MRAISGHVLGESGVQIPQNNLDNLHSIREAEDGATEVLDPEDVPGSFWLEIIDFAILGFDSLALVEGFTNVEDNKGLLVPVGMLFDDATGLTYIQAEYDALSKGFRDLACSSVQLPP